VALFSETHLKPHKRFFIPNYHFYRNYRYLGRKDRTAVAVRKGIPHNLVDLPSLVSVEAYQLVKVKYCLQLFTNLRAGPGVMLTSLHS
jgi:hypothetical protein